MTDQLPSKDQVRITPELAGDLLRRAAATIERLERKLDTCGLECSATLKSLVAENERLRTCLTGISTCSTCEACRGAATRALGEWRCPLHGVVGSDGVWQPDRAGKPKREAR